VGAKDRVVGAIKEIVAEIVGDGRLAEEGARQKRDRGIDTAVAVPVELPPSKQMMPATCGSPFAVSAVTMQVPSFCCMVGPMISQPGTTSRARLRLQAVKRSCLVFEVSGRPDSLPKKPRGRATAPSWRWTPSRS
jgi:hypothetical protein